LFSSPERPEAHPTSYTMENEVLSRDQNGRAVKFNSHPHLVPGLRISGGIPTSPHDTDRNNVRFT